MHRDRLGIHREKLKQAADTGADNNNNCPCYASAE